MTCGESGDQSNTLVYQSGPQSVPNVCNGGQIDDSRGGTFSAVVTSSVRLNSVRSEKTKNSNHLFTHTNAQSSLGVHFRFHYGVHIGTSWSATINVNPYPLCTPIQCQMSSPQTTCGGSSITVSSTVEYACVCAPAFRAQAAISSCCTCPAAAQDCVVNADGSVTIAALPANNHVVVTCTGRPGCFVLRRMQCFVLYLLWAADSASCSETISVIRSPLTIVCAIPVASGSRGGSYPYYPINQGVQCNPAAYTTFHASVSVCIVEKLPKKSMSISL